MKIYIKSRELIEIISIILLKISSNFIKNHQKSPDLALLQNLL